MTRMGAERSGDAAAAGRALRAERERLGFDLEAAARAIRVTPRIVRAIEEGRLEQLPPQPYARGFLEAYAAWLGMGTDGALGLRAGGDGPEGTQRRRPSRREGVAGFPWRDWSLPLGLAVGFAVYLGARAARPPVPETLPERPAAPAAARAPSEPEPGPGAPALEGAPAAGEEAGAMRVLFRFEGETWVELALDGGPVERRAFRPGDQVSVSAREQVAAALGDAGLIRIRVNERELGFVGQRGETRRGLLFVAPKAPGAARSGGTVDAGAGAGAAGD